MLGAMGMEAFAERARRELLITGETARKRTAQPSRTPPGPASEPLTAQEARVAAGPRGSVEPGDWCPPVHQLPAPFSATWARVFTKLGISSRRQLHRVYPSTRIRSRGANPRRLASRTASAGPPLASCPIDLADTSVARTR
jgi:hypothetical protein